MYELQAVSPNYRFVWRGKHDESDEVQSEGGEPAEGECDLRHLAEGGAT